LAAEPSYDADVTKWRQEPPPPKSDTAAHRLWFYAANYSKVDWRLITDNGQVRAYRREDASKEPRVRPPFTPEGGGFRGASVSALIDDGWLVGFNHGEFGAALYWFSHDGKHSYKISDHQVVDFFSLSDGVYAIEGLAHLGESRGSVIRIARPQGSSRWQATSVIELPSAPYAVSLRRDGTMLITLSDALVALGPDRKIDMLLSDAEWGGFYPSSSVLTQNEQKLYIGMRQFVAEFDLTTKALRFLIPSKQFLNKLPRKMKTESAVNPAVDKPVQPTPATKPIGPREASRFGPVG
jgi:hypothetical protein